MGRIQRKVTETLANELRKRFFPSLEEHLDGRLKEKIFYRTCFPVSDFLYHVQQTALTHSESICNAKHTRDNS